MKVLLTGRPGIGKTTVIQNLANLLGDRAGGFLTKEIRHAGARIGFMLESFDGKKALLAEASHKGSPRVGKYRVLVENLERVGIQAVSEASSQKKILLIDEIGKMEILSKRFRDLISSILNSDLKLVATLSVSRHAFLDGIRRSPGVTIIEVTLENRNRLANEILAMIDKEQSRCIEVDC